MKIKYVGVKDFEDAFKGETGVTWGPGVEHDIDDAIAARMLKHPDVFELSGAAVKEPVAPSLSDAVVVTPVADEAPAGSTTEAPAETPADAPAEAQEDAPQKPQFVMQTEEGALVLDFLDKETLKQLAKEADIAVGNSGADKIRQKLVEAFPVKAD